MTLEVQNLEALDDVELTEERMRLALGLGGGHAQRPLTLKVGSPVQAAPRADVPSPSGRQTSGANEAVYRASTPSPLHHRVAELEHQLMTEGQQHDEARRRLRQVQDAAKALEARLQHDDAVHEEKLDTQRQAIVRAQRALDNVVLEAQQHASVPRLTAANSQAAARSAAGSREARIAIRPEPDAVAPSLPSTDPTPPKKRGRPRTHPLPEPKPVRWWTPCYKAKGKG